MSDHSIQLLCLDHLERLARSDIKKGLPGGAIKLLRESVEHARVLAVLDGWSAQHGPVTVEPLGVTNPDEGGVYFWECRLGEQAKGAGHLGRGVDSPHAAAAARAAAAKWIESRQASADRAVGNARSWNEGD